MGFTKFTVSENVETTRQQENDKIKSFVKQAGVASVGELSDEDKEKLQNSLTK